MRLWDPDDITVDCCDCGARHRVADNGWTALRCEGCGRTIERWDRDSPHDELLVAAKAMLVDCTTPDGRSRAPRPVMISALRAAIRKCEEVDR